MHSFIREHEAIIEKEYRAIEEQLRHVIPIENHRGTRFYALVEYSRISGFVYTSFLAPKFGVIDRNGEKYEYWYNEFKKIKFEVDKWQRKSQRNKPFPFEKDLDAIKQYLKSEPYLKNLRKK